MTSYLYAITDRPDGRLPDQAGLDEAGLTQIAWRDIGAVVSEHDAPRRSTGAEEAWRHEAVVEALMEGRAVLPARFGTILPSPADVADMLCRRYAQFVADLDRVRGHVEIGVRMLPSDTPRRPRETPLGTPGTAYFAAKLAHGRALQERRTIHLERAGKACEILARLASDSSFDAGTAERDWTSAAFLVRRERAEAFGLAVSRLAAAHPELTLLCTGPWPPYSFVSAEADDDPQTTRNGHDRIH